MTTIASGLSVYTANTVAPTPSSGTSSVAQTTTTAKPSPTISLSNSATVSLSGAVVVATNTPVKFSAAIAAFKAATTPEAIAALPAYTIKDASTVVTSSAETRETLMAMAVAGKIASIAFTDTTAPKFTFDRAAISGPLDGKDNLSPSVMVLQKITTKYSLAITGISASDAGTVKPPVANATLSFSVSDNVGGVSANLATLQTLAKAKSLVGIIIATDPISPTKPVLSLSAAELKSAPDALKLLKGNIDLTITGMAAGDASKTAGAADVILKAAGSTSLAKVAVSDTAANIAKGIASLELVAAGGRLNSITVNGSEALSLTGAQVKASENVLNVGFTGAPTKVDLKDVLTADMASMEALIEDNQSLIVNKLSIKDTAANIQAKLDQLDAAVEAGSATTASGAFILSNIAVSDKGTITVTNSTFLKDLDALKVVSGAYKLNVTDINVTDALAIKAPSKDATLSLTIKDTAANIAANWDKLQALVKAKTLTTITITDGPSSLLTMTAAQLKANADVLKVVTGDYKLSVTGVAAADVAKTLTTKNIYSVEVKDTVANILKNLPGIKTAVTAAKIQSVIITDATNPTLSIADIFALTTTLPNVTLAAGVKFNVKDTASNVVAHARYDIGDVIKNAGSIALSDKTPPNLTLADATTLKGLTGLVAGTKYTVADGGALIAAQATLSGEKILADAASVVVNKNFTITEAKAVSALKSLAKGSAYSINDTAANILTQSALAGESVLAKANAVNVVDTSANILAKLDQLQVLAKAGKIANIKFTDAPSGALPLTDAQMLNNAEAIGKIISQRTLPELQPTKPVTPAPLGPTLPPMKTLSVWSAETTLGTIVDGSYQFRPYMRADRWGNMIADLVTPAATYNQAGQNHVSFYLMAQDGLGNTSEPLKIADFNTSLGAPGTPRNGAIYLLKPNIYSASYTPNMVDNQLAVWMEQQPDSTYTMKYRPFSFSPALAAAGSTVSPLTTTGSATTLVSGIDQHMIGFNWVTNASSSKFLMEYETLTPGMADKKDIYINTFTVGGTGNNVTATTTNKIASGSNEGARLLTSGLNASAVTTVYNNPVDSSIMFIQETTKSNRSGLLISNLDAANGLVANSDRFLDIGPSASGIKINAFEFGGVSTDAAVSTPSVEIIAASTTVPAATSADKPVYKIQFFKGDPALSGSAGTANIIATDSLNLSNPVKAMWNQANIGNNTTMFAFQDGNVVHAVQVGFDGKIMADDQFAIPAGSTFDRYRPLGFTNPTAPYLPLYEFIWREPISGSTTGETSIKSRIYDARGTTPLTVNGWNAFNLIAGAAGNDTLVGRGNDVISGGPGNDTINGLLGGKDVVSYLGKSTDYSIISDANDVFKVVVKDLRSGSPDGTDTLTNVLALRFADKTITLLQATPEKTLTQNFLTTSPGITSATNSNAKGFIALTGTETGALSVRLVSGNGSLPTNGSALIDAIVNAATPSAFKTAVQTAKTQGVNSVPAFTIEISKTLTTPIDLNVDGTKETGVRVPLDINMESTTVGDVSLIPRPLTNVTQQISLSLNQSFLHVGGGPAYSTWGTSGSNSNGIDTNSFYFSGNEPGTIKLRMGMNDSTQPITVNALKLAANIATATTPQLFEQAMQDYWSAGNGQFWVDFSMSLTNPVDINGDGKNDTNVSFQINYYADSKKSDSIIFSPIAAQISSPISQTFLTLPSGKNAFCFSTSGPSGTMDLIGNEKGHFDVTLNNDRTSFLPLPLNYQSLMSNIVNASNIEDFKSALDVCLDLNLRISINYVLDSSIYLDIDKNGILENNIYVGIIYDKNLPNIFSTLSMN